MTQKVDRAERRTDVRDAMQYITMDALHNDADVAGELNDAKPVGDYGFTLHFTDGDVVHVLVLSDPSQLGDTTALGILEELERKHSLPSGSTDKVRSLLNLPPYRPDVD